MTSAAHPNSPDRRFYDPRFEAVVVVVPPGEHRITDRPDEMLSTVLGSCVAVCMRDPSLKLGGMNHFLLPAATGDNPGSNLDGLSYGDTAMEVLINGLLRRGALRRNLEAKVFGGARVLAHGKRFAIGDQNINFVNKFLHDEKIPVVAEDVGGTFSRRIVFHPETGKVKLMQTDPAQAHKVASEETAYASRLAKKPVVGSLELF